MSLQEAKERLVFEHHARLDYVNVGRDAGTDRLQKREKERAYLCRRLRAVSEQMPNASCDAYCYSKALGDFCKITSSFDFWSRLERKEFMLELCDDRDPLLRHLGVEDQHSVVW